MGVASQYRDSVGCKSGNFQHGVGDLGPIRGEGQIVFRPRVVSQALGFAVGEHFHVDLIGRKETAASANERKHATVPRQGGSGRGIREIGELREL
jgi:hypothetical protein